MLVFYYGGLWRCLFSLITLIACAVIVYYFCTTEDRRIQSALSFVFAGALGNWIDRLRFGYVRDFLVSVSLDKVFLSLMLRMYASRWAFFLSC